MARYFLIILFIIILCPVSYAKDYVLHSSSDYSYGSSHDYIALSPKDEVSVYKNSFHPKSKNSNYGGGKQLTAGWWTSDTLGGFCPGCEIKRGRAFLKFDLSSIPDNAIISEVRLDLHHFLGWNYDRVDVGDEIGVYVVSDLDTDLKDWTRYSLTWNNAPTEWGPGTTKIVKSNTRDVSFTIPKENVQGVLKKDVISLAVKLVNEKTDRLHYFCGTGRDDKGIYAWDCHYDGPELWVDYTLPCAEYRNEKDCSPKPACVWCDSCKSGQMVRASCVEKKKCVHVCTEGICNAACDSSSTWNNVCEGSIRKYSGSCGDNCNWNYESEDCDAKDGWYKLNNIRTVKGKKCSSREQQESEYRDYSCTPSKCAYTVTETKWVNTRELEDKYDIIECNVVNDSASLFFSTFGWEQSELDDFIGTYNLNLDKVPKIIKSIIGNGRINLYIILSNGGVIRYGAVTEKARIIKLKAGGLEKPTINMYTTEEVMQKILDSDNPGQAVKYALDSGGIEYKGVGIVNKMKTRLMSFGLKIFSWFS
ncbi:DNRLRE domain-containing protein [Candidatus Woesearchaeota archaeon]|nr:DNRLRE domain-containing protein [Candidatus Woesearchaeota archaeon]